jgi:hypothetical protein
MAKKIKFYVKNKLIKDSFSVTKKHIPKWYKDLKPDGQIPGIGYKKTVKSCIPFLDAMMLGYCIEATQDLVVSLNDDRPTINWNIESYDVLTVNVRDESLVPPPPGFYDIPYIWKMVHSVQLPKGYSALFTHPLNRTDLPFYSLSGVVDADYPMHAGNYPFFLKKEFEGVIKAGTPIVQIIPFKRESWKNEFSEELSEIQLNHSFLSNQVVSGWYKDKLWKKKSFE